MALFKRKPPFQLSRLLASPDGLYDGSFLRQAALWWNHEMQHEPKLAMAGCQRITDDDYAKLKATIQPENRSRFAAIAGGVSLEGRASEAVLSLAYAFALVIELVISKLPEGNETSIGTPARAFTPDELSELSRHYNEQGWALEYDQWAPYWRVIESEFPPKIGQRVLALLRQAFDDQVDRWSAAEGFDLRNSIGPPDFSLVAAEEGDGVRFHNFVELLFEWGGRLRLGEAIIASGDELNEHRFSHNPDLEFTDHLFDEALERYWEIAQREAPVEPDVEEAAGIWAQPSEGQELSSDQKKLISTAVIRGFVWRSVEEGATGFLEPELSEAVAKSRTLGDDRSDDEPYSFTLYYAALQQMIDGVKTRLGSIGGLMSGPKNYEKAYFVTTRDFADYGIEISESDQRQAFQFGVCLADAHRVLSGSNAYTGSSS